MGENNNISSKTSFECSGCTACLNGCPRNAISMKSDSMGFKYPYVDDNLCNSCGKCLLLCPFKDNKKLAYNQHYYAIRHKDEGALSQSQSGGAFVILSDYILEQGGVVYGVGLDNRFLAIHKRATNKDERDEFRYSKYIQSDLGGIFKLVKDDLGQGKLVLFTGTPCQVAGLNSFLNLSLKDNLYTIDLICHGVSSPALWGKYLDYIKAKYGTFQSVLFRDKSIGWKSHKESFIYNDHKVTRKTFASLFYSSLALRKSCYNCHFTNFSRPSDITIADLWGWKNIPDELNDNKGISIALINSEKGSFLFNKAKKDHFCQEIEQQDFDQPQLHSSVPLPSNRDLFEEEFALKGFKYIGIKYADLGIIAKIKDVLRPIYHKIK